MKKSFIITFIIAAIIGYGTKDWTPFLTIMGIYIVGTWIWNAVTNNPP
jgi:type IV secretory pathway TrbD component